MISDGRYHIVLPAALSAEEAVALVRATGAELVSINPLRDTLEDFSYNLKFRVQAGPRKGQMDPRPLAQHVATAFLGVRLECAECHKHPHDRWSQTLRRGAAHSSRWLRSWTRRTSRSRRHRSGCTRTC